METPAPAPATKDRLLAILDRALEEPARERDGRAARQMLAEIRRKYGDLVASGYANQGICMPGVQRQMKSLLDGPAPVRATATPAAPTPRPASTPAPPKPTPARIATDVLHRLVIDQVRHELPNGFLEMDEPHRRKELLRACWKTHCDEALPTALQAEVPAAVAGLKRAPANVGAAAAAFRREAITRRIKKLKITAQ